ncbi:hypothetical protein BOTBODRAFT_186079 [Botryobasidium botryosum FD-172 SS1]|uniref:F-box domain-containing protein n=1 Tax=Botryobasidium botryosum (strain FD-172 SS1) TaxID=930990 RepID=A0A067MRV4_BOTB1|nr:hypothetical protein BOTBODRAFT_186079 [Botryobasidium botryosum FD-172 SS1]
MDQQDVSLVAPAAPLLRLPNEILLEVFELSVDDQPLWSNINLYVRHKSIPVDMLATRWLERAKGCPLSLMIDCIPIPEGSTAEELRAQTLARFERLAILLQGCMERWQELLVTATTDYLHPFFRVCVGLTPCLRRIEINLLEGRPEGDHDFPTPLTLFLPFEQHHQQKSRLEIACDDFLPAVTPSLGLRLTDLRLCFMEGMLTIPLVTSLELFPNLRTLYVSAYGSTFTYPSRPRTLLQHLESISISEISNAATLFRHLHMPALRSMKLYGLDQDIELLEEILRQIPDALSSITISWDWAETSPSAVSSHRLSETITLPGVIDFRLLGYVEFSAPIMQMLVLPQLKHLHHEMFPIDVSLRLMEASDAIVSAKVLLINTPPSSVAVATSIPTLDHFELSVPTHETEVVLARLHAPNLTSLILNAMGRDGPFIPLHTFIQESNPPLRSLTLNGVKIRDADLIRCFKATPSLESLSLFNCSLSDAVLQALTDDPHSHGERQGAGSGAASGCLLPHLVDLELLNNPNLSIPAMMNFFTARKAMALPVTQCQVCLPCAIKTAQVFMIGMNGSVVATFESLGVAVCEY